MSADRILCATLAAGAMSLAAACASRISSDRDETIPIPQGATWAWSAREAAARYDDDPTSHNEIVAQRFRRAMEGAMQARGFQKVEDASQADFLLSFRFGGAERQPRARTAAVVGVGWYDPWLWGPYPRRGWYGRPGWGWYGWPGWGFYGPPLWGGAMIPMYQAYPAGPGAISLVALLRQRSTGYVAWRGQYLIDPYDAQRVSQGRVQEIVDRLFRNLR